MQPRASFFLLPFAFALTACGGGGSGFNNPPVNTLTAGGQAVVSRSPQSAQGGTTSSIIPIQMTAFVPCANGGSGESVTLSGNEHMVNSVTVTANNLHLDSLTNPQGVSGVGSVTGDKYQFSGVFRDDLNIANPGFPDTATLIYNSRVIGQGTASNFQFHQNSQVTINANGTVTVLKTNVSVQCN